MAFKIQKTGTMVTSDPYDFQIAYDIGIAGAGLGMDIWITSGPTYTISELTLTYDGKETTIYSTDDGAATFTAHLYQGEYFYRRGEDTITVTGKKNNGDPVKFTGGGTVYTIQWDALNTAPTANISSGTPFAGRECTVNWNYSDADGDEVTLVSLIRYYRAPGAAGYAGTTLLTSSTLKSYTDRIPDNYGGGTLYYEITFADTYGGTGSVTTSAYTVIANSAPTVPGIPVLPGRIDGGASVVVSWTASTDADGNLEGYKLERSADGGGWVQVYQGTSNAVETVVPSGISSVTYRVKAYDTYGAESGYAETEALVVYNNTTPAAPVSIAVPNEISTGSSPVISWAAVVDPDGDAVTYHLERSVNGGTFAEIFSGSATAYTDTIGGNFTTVAYRVYAKDANGAKSAYTTSPTRTIILNYAPVISLVNGPESGDYGVVSEAFTQQVKIADKDGDTVRIRYLLDGEEIGDDETTVPAEGFGVETFSFTDWRSVSNGEHILTFSASDGASEASVSVRFTKEVRDAVVMLDTPLTASEKITLCVISVNGYIPEDAEMKVDVTNNGNDASPVWEDATQQALTGMNHAFTNAAQTNGWAFNFRVTLHGGDTRGYITSIQGGFQ